MWTEADVAYFQLLTQQLRGRVKETMKTLSQNTQYPSRESNQGPWEYVERILPTSFYNVTI
jgi:hypothetical protein